METIEFLGFNIHAWITIATVLTMFTILLTTKLRTDLVFLGAIGVLFVTGVLDAKEAFSGFSSTSVVVIGVLFVVVAGLTYTGVLQWMVKHLLGQPDSYSKAIFRLMLPVAALSSFLSNTTVVALFVNIVKMWSKKLGIAPSKLLIPLSYASGMGGVCTLIGTPPNLIISGLYADHSGHAMNVLATTIPGLFCLLVGILSILAMRKLLPDRKAPDNAFESGRQPAYRPDDCRGRTLAGQGRQADRTDTLRHRHIACGRRRARHGRRQTGLRRTGGRTAGPEGESRTGECRPPRVHHERD